MQVVLPLGHLTFVNIPLAKAHHIAKNVKHQRNIVYLFSGKNCKVTWQRVCIQEEVKKIGQLIQSTTGEGLKQLLWYQDCHIWCAGVSCTTAPGESDDKGLTPALTPCPKAMYSGMGLCPFSNKSATWVNWRYVWHSPIKGYKNYYCITVYPLYAITNFLIRFFNSIFLLLYVLPSTSKPPPPDTISNTCSMYESQYTKSGCQGFSVAKLNFF